MQNKILITGSNGLLGQKLIQFFSQQSDYNVIGCSRGENRITSIDNFTYYNVDITDKNKFTEILHAEKPSIIINCAAMTNVDLCEEKKEECDNINVDVLKNMVLFCKKNNTKLIHLSTDFIFDGNKGFYKEEDTPNPVNYYGESKLKSENIIVENLTNYAIIRTILVYGTTENTNRGNIVSWVKNNLEAGKKINVVNDQFRMPTLVDDLLKAIALIVQKDAVGIFHISSNELLSIYEIALLVADAYKLNTQQITAIPSSKLNQKAKRPLKTGFNLHKSESVLGFKPKSFKEQLLQFKEELK